MTIQQQIEQILNSLPTIQEKITFLKFLHKFIDAFHDFIDPARSVLIITMVGQVLQQSPYTTTSINGVQVDVLNLVSQLFASNKNIEDTFLNIVLNLLGSEGLLEVYTVKHPRATKKEIEKGEKILNKVLHIKHNKKGGMKPLNIQMKLEERRITRSMKQELKKLNLEEIKVLRTSLRKKERKETYIQYINRLFEEERPKKRLVKRVLGEKTPAVIKKEIKEVFGGKVPVLMRDSSSKLPNEFSMVSQTHSTALWFDDGKAGEGDARTHTSIERTLFVAPQKYIQVSTKEELLIEMPMELYIGGSGYGGYIKIGTKPFVPVTHDNCRPEVFPYSVVIATLQGESIAQIEAKIAQKLKDKLTQPARNHILQLVSPLCYQPIISTNADKNALLYMQSKAFGDKLQSKELSLYAENIPIQNWANLTGDRSAGGYCLLDNHCLLSTVPNKTTIYKRVVPEGERMGGANTPEKHDVDVEEEIDDILDNEVDGKEYLFYLTTLHHYIHCLHKLSTRVSTKIHSLVYTYIETIFHILNYKIDFTLGALEKVVETGSYMEDIVDTSSADFMILDTVEYLSELIRVLIYIIDTSKDVPTFTTNIHRQMILVIENILLYCDVPDYQRVFNEEVLTLHGFYNLEQERKIHVPMDTKDDTIKNSMYHHFNILHHRFMEMLKEEYIEKLENTSFVGGTQLSNIRSQGVYPKAARFPKLATAQLKAVRVPNLAAAQGNVEGVDRISLDSQGKGHRVVGQFQKKNEELVQKNNTAMLGISSVAYYISIAFHLKKASDKRFDEVFSRDTNFASHTRYANVEYNVIKKLYPIEKMLPGYKINEADIRERLKYVFYIYSLYSPEYTNVYKYIEMQYLRDTTPMYQEHDILKAIIYPPDDYEPCLPPTSRGGTKQKSKKEKAPLKK